MEQKPLVIFSHGKMTGPKGSRILALSEVALTMGFDVDSIDYRRLSTPERVNKLNTYLEDLSRPYVLVGTSMGGYVSAVAGLSHDPIGIFLMSPALYMDGYAEADLEKLNCPVTVIHGWDDDIVPLDNALRFAKTAGAELHIFPGGHRLREKLAETEHCFEQFLRQCFVAHETQTSIKIAANS